MRTISPELQAHLEGEVTTIAMCWKIQRQDGVIMARTDHDNIITYDEVDYLPLNSGMPSNWSQASNLAPSNMDLSIAYAAAAGTDAELRAGLYDYAQVWTFRINWMDTTMGIVKLAYGRLGEVEIRDNEAKIEVRSLTQLLAIPIGRIYTPECDATLGDTRCKVAMAPYTKWGMVIHVDSNKKFTIGGDASNQVVDYYNYGKAVWLTGANTGIIMQIEDYTDANVVTLFETMPYTIANSDTATFYAGCDRRFTTCKTRFSNKDNFRGFPNIPGMDKALSVPSNRAWTVVGNP